ncbi:MAG: DUF4282 domain-containing protein [Kiritimatiellales bacterium]
MNKEDFFNFKKMITPVIIKILFWIGIAIAVLSGLIMLFSGAILQGLMCIILGPIFVRVYCELLIVVFSINDTLTEIKNQLKKE